MDRRQLLKRTAWLAPLAFLLKGAKAPKVKLNPPPRLDVRTGGGDTVHMAWKKVQDQFDWLIAREMERQRDV